jgi:hypothetical protein
VLRGALNVMSEITRNSKAAAVGMWATCREVQAPPALRGHYETIYGLSLARIRCSERVAGILESLARNHSGRPAFNRLLEAVAA